MISPFNIRWEQEMIKLVAWLCLQRFSCPYFNTNYYILPAFFYMMMETSIQANGMIIQGKEKLTTRTERSIRDTGMCILRDTDQEFYILQMEKQSIKASGRTMSIKARSNTTLFTFVPQLCFIISTILFAY